ncbi:MAG: thiamine pyrophosphate-binding protein [bacterium]
MTLTLADVLVAYLEKLGVDYVFGVPGSHIAALYEALSRSAARGGVRAILARHESGAASMADGYARETGKLGVCCATTGPGATNLVTGVASAYTDHTPLLVLTGQTPLAKFGMAAFQESSPDLMDTTAMLAQCTYYSSVITHVQQFENKLAKALMMALRTPRGPVHLSIPIDLSRAPMTEGIRFPQLSQLLQRPALVDRTAVETLIQQITPLRAQQQPIVLLVGHECAHATEAIMAFAECLDASIVTTQRGKTWVNPFHPRVKGVFGYAGHASARQVLAQDACGMVIALGSGLGQWSTSAWDKCLLNERLVHVHPCADYFARSPMARLHIQGDVKTVVETALEGLAKRSMLSDSLLANVPNVETPPNDETLPPARKPLSPENLPAYLAVCPPHITLRHPEGYQQTDAVPIHPQAVVFALMQGCFPANTRFIVDTTNWLPWTLHYFFIREHQYYRLSSELAAMGWGLAAAVGTAMGCRGVPVVSLVGDGGVLMSGQEITVAVEEQLPVIYLILNDRHYGMVQHRHYQVSDVAINFDFPAANFKQMAEAVGAQGFRVTSMQAWQALDFDAIVQHSGPTVIDLVIDPTIAPPMGMF